jgi:hypothetical protein
MEAIPKQKKDRFETRDRHVGLEKIAAAAGVGSGSRCGLWAGAV